VVVSEPAEQSGPTPTVPQQPSSQTQQNLAIQRTRRSARWDEVRARRGAGYGIARIAREMGMHRRTVRRYLAAPAPPRNRPAEHPKPTGLTSPTLQPFVEYLQGRWQAGWTNVAQLQRELELAGANLRRASALCLAAYAAMEIALMSIQVPRAIRAAIHYSCKRSSPGAVRVHRRSPAAVDVAAGHALSASTCAGCACVHRPSSSRMN
jgi:hypothetical protein